MIEWKETERLCVRITESDRLEHRNLAERIVETAHRHGLGGATAWRGHLSWGQSSHFHTSKVLDLGNDLPVLVEIIDVAEKIETFLPMLDAMLGEAGCGALTTRETLQAWSLPHRR